MSKPEINVTPLIDVLLVLLIIFMVITPLKPHKFETKIPSEPKHDRAQPDPRTIVVTVHSDSSLQFNKELTAANIESPQPMIDKIADVFTLREVNLEKERTVFIKAPKSLAYGSVAKVIDAVKVAGAKPISLQIDELE
ncbi:MAG TPA: biopolymer transporter ExbD [Pyrinomonadaceae bacterium]|jgi:biopolymer transport protein ExbD|nr:biopolymer transporter ExbD [Pyrinomonadaceae bacterium]